MARKKLVFFHGSFRTRKAADRRRKQEARRYIVTRRANGETRYVVLSRERDS